MNRDLRIKILTRLAQTTTENKPTVAGAPSAFLASSYYPTLNTGWGIDNAHVIDGLMQTINIIIFYSSDGELQLTGGTTPLAVNNFQIDESKYPDPLRKLLLFCKTVFKELLNSRNPFPKALTDEERKARIAMVRNDQSLNSFPSTNPAGQLATKLPTNAKTLIITYLDKLH